MAIQQICVFCGSSPGAGPDFLAAAEALGVAMANRGYSLVYGGARVGLMGRLADTLIDRGARVVGVMPAALVDREVAHPGIDDLRVVSTMHERKALMAELADAFIALPGGLGTLEELLETITWAQLGLHHKPCAILNTNDYFGSLLKFLDHAASQRFLSANHRSLVLQSDEPEALLDLLTAYDPPQIDKAEWIHAVNADPGRGHE